jgi:hemoglobin
MYDFWENVLFQAGVYRGGMMMKHIVLNQKSPLRQEHFDRWLALFTQTLDELYSGPTTEEARRRAYLVANTIRTRLNPGSHSLLSPQNSKRAAN